MAQISRKMLDLERIKQLSHEVGFDLCGVARPRTMEQDGEFLCCWLDEGNGSTLEYMKRNIDKRTDATLLVEGAKTVIVCALAYKNEISEGYPADHPAKVASYACMTDYHTTIREMLHRLCKRLREESPTLRGRVFVDSAPLFEKRYAVEAGLGWIGRQSLLVTPQFGTFVLLGEAVLCEECNAYDEPLQGAGCGECRRCVEACPNGAIRDQHIDTRRCISRMTIEREENPHKEGGSECNPDSYGLHGWVFGCDECQSCCPYNRRAPHATHPAVAPLFDPRLMNATDWQKTSEAEFSSRFASTPLSRSSLERIQRNIKKSR